MDEKLRKEKKREYDRAYREENRESKKKYLKGYHEKNRLQVLAKIDPAMKCANCGCDEPRFLEVNHINGGGRKKQKTRGTGVTQNSILLIQTGKRGIEDLNLLCKPCNALDHLERVFGKTPFRVVWE